MGIKMLPTTHVEFTSLVDKKGYRIIPGKRPPPRRPGQKESDWVLDLRSTDWTEARIVGVGGQLQRLHLIHYPMLFKEFANVKTPQDLLAFVTKYGPLTPSRKGDEIPPLLDEAASMKDCFKRGVKKLPVWPNLKAWFATDAKGTVSLKISPVRLLDAIWLQLGQALSEGAQWRQCEHCGDWFPVGGKSGRRLVARFCSDQHRIDFNSLERSR
jgi:hypothetical protein